MSRFSRFLPLLLVACVVFAAGVDLLHQARVRGETRKLRPPAMTQRADLIPESLRPRPPIPPPPAGDFPFP